MNSMMRKVPQITALFWIVKICTTAFGESMSDFLVLSMNPELAVVLGFILFVIALALQFRAKRYNAWIYWFAVSMVAVFGTMAADVLHIGFGIPYLDTTIFFAAALVVVFALWYAVEGTLSIHSITTKRREVFYWLTVVTTFALGTAAGDMTATTLGLGYLASGVLFTIAILLVGIAHLAAKVIVTGEHRRLSRDAVLAFWLAYILTRPLGASFADWMGKSPTVGGLGWGDGTVAAGLALVIVILVGYFAVSRIDIERGKIA